MLIKHVLLAAALFAMTTGIVHAQDWEQEDPSYEGDVVQDEAYQEPAYEEDGYSQEEYVQDDDVQEESEQDEYVQEEPVQDEPVQEEYVQEDPQYEQPEEIPADSTLENDWLLQMGSQCTEYADADGLEGTEREEFMRSCMQQ